MRKKPKMGYGYILFLASGSFNIKVLTKFLKESFLKLRQESSARRFFSRRGTFRAIEFLDFDKIWQAHSDGLEESIDTRNSCRFSLEHLKKKIF